MEYFTLTSQKGNPMPRIQNWYGKIDVRKLNRNDYQELPRFVLLDMKTGTDVYYPDIMTEPFLLVSKEALEVIRMYESDMPFLFFALFDGEKEESASYYCPILENQNKNAAIYRDMPGNKIKIRLDLAESLLLRGAEGMELMG